MRTVYKIGLFVTVVVFALFSFFWGAGSLRQPVEFPVSQEKRFVILFYAHNSVDFYERMLRSVFEQNYSGYRVLFIDDASVDGTFEQAQKFCLEQDREECIALIKNETFLGPFHSLLRGIELCSDGEIVIPLNGWLSHSKVLSELNRCFQNPAVWVVGSLGVEYPSYKIRSWKESRCYPTLFFYAELFRSLSMEERYGEPLLEHAKGHVRIVEKPLILTNSANQRGFLRSERGRSEGCFFAALFCKLDALSKRVGLKSRALFMS